MIENTARAGMPGGRCRSRTRVALDLVLRSKAPSRYGPESHRRSKEAAGREAKAGPLGARTARASTTIRKGQGKKAWPGTAALRQNILIRQLDVEELKKPSWWCRRWRQRARLGSRHHDPREGRRLEPRSSASRHSPAGTLSYIDFRARRIRRASHKLEAKSARASRPPKLWRRGRQGETFTAARPEKLWRHETQPLPQCGALRGEVPQCFARDYLTRTNRPSARMAS